jgi:predicted transcriptional regulator
MGGGRRKAGAKIIAAAQQHNVITADELPSVIESITAARDPNECPTCHNRLVPTRNGEPRVVCADYRCDYWRAA